jgi:signal transduction histidine kinase
LVSVADRVTTIVHDAADQLGFRPNLIISGDPETLPARVAAQIEPVLTEALANVHRHANASWANVSMVVNDRAMTLTIADDGVGFDPGGPRGNGLNNLHARAVELGGTSSVASTTGQGTTLSWTATFD